MSTDENLDAVLGTVETQAAIIEGIINHFVVKHSKDLDEIIRHLHDAVKATTSLGISDDKLEDYTLKIPLYLYYASGELEDLGAELDTAVSLRKALYNKALRDCSPSLTATEKKAIAETAVIHETIMENALNRAYTKLRMKIESAKVLSDSVKKLLTKRMDESNVLKRSGGFSDRR